MVTKTREQIDTEHNTNIQEIRASYHNRQEISHEEYHDQLAAENERYEAELIANGYSLVSAPTQWQEEWERANTTGKEISVLARMQGLEAPPDPPRSTHISVVDTIDTTKARPVKVKRVWEGKDYFYDCLVTEGVKDQYLAGDVVVGDYVIVHFDAIGELVVTAKVFKSW